MRWCPEGPLRRMECVFFLVETSFNREVTILYRFYYHAALEFHIGWFDEDRGFVYFLFYLILLLF